MSAPANVSPASVEQLTDRVIELERRIAALEAERTTLKHHAVAPTAVTPPGPPVATTWQGFPSPQMPATVPVIGKAVLGIAGAYLLRALAESGAIPRIPVLLLAIVYAGLWMALAIRAHGRTFPSFVYAATSVLILSPLLWESTVAFQYLPPGATGIILVLFCAAVLGWTSRLRLELIPWITVLAVAVTALALFFETHRLVALTLSILAIAAVTELAACFGYHRSLRVIPALAADVAVCLTVYILSSPSGTPDGYYPATATTLVALWLCLLVLYVGSIGFRSFWLNEPIPAIDNLQGAIVVLIAIFGALRASSTFVVPALGALLLLYCAGCYWGALSRFSQHDRNRRTSATWAALLFVIGSLLVFPAVLQVILLCALAVLMTVLYGRSRKVSIGLHPSFFLLSAAVASQAHLHVLNSLAGTVPGAPVWAVWILVFSAAVCYVLGSRLGEPSRRALWIVPAAVVSLVIASSLVVLIVGYLAPQGQLDASRISMIRTMVNCALALVLAVAGFRWKRRELVWMSYAAVGFGTLKLIFEDLRYGNPGTLVFSLLFYGVILILLPKLNSRTRITNQLSSQA